MQGLTKRQLQTLDFIRHSINQRGYPPTLREIGEHMGIRSTNGVNDHLRALERKGYLRREDMKSRALKLVESMVAASDAANNTTPPESFDADDMVEVQILGRVAAGLPLLAEENVVDTVHVDRGLLRGGRDVFGLRVAGDSMVEAGILNGDYIFVRKQPTADRGDVVVALIGDEEIGKAILEVIGASRAVLLKNHGVFTVGKSGEDAVKAAVMVEDIAHTVWIALQLGIPEEITPEDVKKLHHRYTHVYGQ